MYLVQSTWTQHWALTYNPFDCAQVHFSYRARVLANKKDYIKRYKALLRNIIIIKVPAIFEFIRSYIRPSS